jgi:hypothetical protein
MLFMATAIIVITLIALALALIVMALAHEIRALIRSNDNLAQAVRRLNDLLLAVLESETPTPTAFAINQVAPVAQGDSMSTPPVTPTPQILGITLGNVGTFNTIVTAPSGAAFPAGTQFQWASSDPLTTLTPSADTTSVAVATTTSDTATSLTLTCTSTFTPPGASAPLSATATVPLNAPAPPPVPTPTAFAINQVS